MSDFDAETSGCNSSNSNSRGSKLEGQIVAIFTGLKVHMFSSIRATNTRNSILVSDGKGISVTLSGIYYSVRSTRSSSRLKNALVKWEITCEITLFAYQRYAVLNSARSVGGGGWSGDDKGVKVQTDLAHIGVTFADFGSTSTIGQSRGFKVRAVF